MEAKIIDIKTRKAIKPKRPAMLSPLMTAKVAEIKALLAKGDVEGATAVLNEAWNVAGQHRASRTVAHDLGNEIQKALFAQYEAAHAQGGAQ
jgi:hypothetical protein